MPIPYPVHAFDQLARKWRDLADRRKAHFAELHHTGRWRHYYTEDQFVAQMREVVRAAETWAQIVRLRSTAKPAE